MNADQLLAHYHRIADAPDAIARLRQFIFDLAVRGKLTAQRPKDETPIKLDRAVADIDPHFDIPANWTWSRLSALGKLRGGGTPSKSRGDFWNGDIPWVSPKDMKTDYIAKAQMNISEAAIAGSAVNLIEPGSILFVVRGMILAHSFPVAVSRVSLTINQDMKAVLLKHPQMAEYILRALKGLKPQMLKRVQRSSHGTCRIEGSDYANFLIPIPPLTEQHRIVAKVDELMVLCDRLEIARAKREATRDRLAAASLARLNAPDPDPAAFANDTRFALTNLAALTTRPDQVKQLRQTILNLAVCGRLATQLVDDVPVSESLKRLRGKSSPPFRILSQENGPYTLPFGWAWLGIDSLVHSLKNDIRTGPFGSALQKDEHQLNGLPVWGIESIGKDGRFTGRNKIFVTPEKAKSLVPFSVAGGDIIISRSGTVGEICRLPDDVPIGFISTNLMKISLDKNIVHPEYFIILIRGSASIGQQLSDMCLGSTRVFLTQAILGRLLFPLPPLAEQHRILARVDELIEMCDQLEAGLAAAQTGQSRLLNALLHEALAPAELRDEAA